jgi:hypothetical protein
MMTFKRSLAAGLLSVRNRIIYVFVLLYIVIYVLGVAGVLPPLTGRFIAPAAMLLYALLSAVFEAGATAESGNYGNSDDINNMRFRVIRNAATGELLLPLSEISEGDSVICSKGDYIPFAGDTVGGHAYIFENGEIIEKRPEKGRDRKESYRIKPGSVVYAGNIIIEVGDKNPKNPKKAPRKKNNLRSVFRKSYYQNRSLLWWVRRIGVLLAVLMFIIRFFLGDMLVLGTYEAVLDNICLSFCLVCLAIPFWQGDGVFTAAFAKLKSLRIKPGTDLGKLGKAAAIAVDGKLFYPKSEPVFNVIMTSAEASREFQNLTDITKVPEPIRSLLAVNIKTMTENRFGFISEDPDMQALRRFALFDGDDYAESDIELLAEIPETPSTRYAAATFRQFGLTATEYYGKPNFRKNGYAHDEAGRKALEPAAIDRLYAVFKTLAAEGKRVRICAVNRSHIHNGVLPSEGWLILGYFVFPAVPTFAVKKSVIAAANEGYKISLIKGSNSPTYNEWLNNTLRLEKLEKLEKSDRSDRSERSERSESTAAEDTEDEETAGGYSDAAVVADAFSLAQKTDFVIAAGCAGGGVRYAADVVTKSEDPADGFTEAVGLISVFRRFGIYVKVFSLLTLLLVLFVFVLYTFILSPLPVAIGDDIIPMALATAFLTPMVELLFLKIV